MPQYLILADDYRDAEALSRRLAVREEHLARMRVEKEKGTFIVGGAKLNEWGQMCGSMLVVQLDDEPTVRQWAAEDPYIKGRVWETMQVIRFRVAAV